MEEFKNLDEFKIFLRSLSCEEIFKIADGIDEKIYPEKHRLAIKIATDKSIERNRNIYKGILPQGVCFIKNVQGLVIIAGLLNVIRIVLAYDSINYYGLFYFVFIIIVSCSIYYGISHVKEWIVPLVLITAVLSLLGNMQYVWPDKSNNNIYYFDIVTSFIGFAYNGYEIYVFTKADTKKFFKNKESNII